HLDQLQPALVQTEHAALSDVEHRLSPLEGFAAGEGSVLDLAHEFALSVRREAADEDHLLRVLADVDEAAGAGQARAELADVEVAFGVGLREAEEGDVQPASIVEVELVGLVDDGLRVHRGAEVQSTGRDTAD